MRMISPSVSMITENDPFKKIEKVGRTCYKSEDMITEDSARKFYHGLVKRKHTAMVEHATFVFLVDAETYQYLYGHKFLNYTYDSERHRCLISGNLRALNESREPVLLKALYEIDPDLVYTEIDFDFAQEELPEFTSIRQVNLFELPCLSKEEFMAHAYFTFHFITDRGVTHEMVRHRPASFAQESTRYCNYTKEKFGEELTFIKPTGWDDFADVDRLKFITAFDTCEDEYIRLISRGFTPQQARAVLPNALKTEIIMTANAQEWEHFFDLRSRGVTGAPHPDIKVVADKALELYEIAKIVALGP